MHGYIEYIHIMKAKMNIKMCKIIRIELSDNSSDSYDRHSAEAVLQCCSCCDLLLNMGCGGKWCHKWIAELRTASRHRCLNVEGRLSRVFQIAFWVWRILKIIFKMTRATSGASAPDRLTIAVTCAQCISRSQATNRRKVISASVDCHPPAMCVFVALLKESQYWQVLTAQESLDSERNIFAHRLTKSRHR